MSKIFAWGWLVFALIVSIAGLSLMFIRSPIEFITNGLILLFAVLTIWSLVKVS